MRRFLEANERTCTFECCGLQSFDVTPHRTRDWIRSWGTEAARSAHAQLEVLRGTLAELGEEHTARIDGAPPARVARLLFLAAEWSAILDDELRRTDDTEANEHA